MRQILGWISSVARYRLVLYRGADAKPGRITAARRSRLRWASPLAVVAVCAAGMASVVPVAASTSGASTATVNIAVRSITVSPASFTFDSCGEDGTTTSTGSVLVIPGGTCGSTSAITVTNGSAPGHVDVQGVDAIPADAGTHWTLCSATVDCSGPSLGCGGCGNYPGADQFTERDQVGANNGPDLTTSAQCDTVFAPSSCAASSSQAVVERVSLWGPNSSTDGSTSFTTVWTWTAVP
jgi:hypothetical protein